ncbi:hypothetical protein [Oceanobacillus neutriphilus]|uniref:Uncharacterized protein n=1 Tax=Oceanobacillus neutriphilus TaxID=531815 RepID=A0ABQ2NSP0_9BACI|nr:hypothetical protein [Oceanobacillus neutriphilus]GGP09623.1 hypothetical protein GCM10011346_14550 [Oceanobacillus neutriphilus]
MSNSKTEKNNAKVYFQSNLPSVMFHFFLTVSAMLLVLFTNQIKGIFFSILIIYALFGLFLTNQGTLLKNLQSVSLVFIINLILYTLLPVVLPQALMFYSLPYIYLGFINGQFIYLAVILPSVCMLIGLYVKVLMTSFKK